MEIKFFSLYKNELRIHHSTSIKEQFMKLDPNGLNTMGVVKDIYDNRDAYLDSKGFLHVKGTRQDVSDPIPVPPSTEYVAGSFDSNTGAEKTSASSVRTVNYIEVSNSYKYTIQLSDIAKYFRFFFYDSSKNFISCTDEGTVNGGVISTVPPSNAKYMKFKFGSEDQVQSTALSIAQNIKIIVSTNDGTVVDPGETDPGDPNSTVEAGSLDTNTGKTKDSDTSVRASDYISISDSYEYTLNFSGTVDYFRFHFYDSSKNFLGCTDDGTVKNTITTTPISNAKYMKFKFTASDNKQSTGLTIGNSITITKSKIESSAPSTPTPDPGTTQPGTDGLLYRFGMLADTHIDGDGDDEAYSHSDFKNAISFLNDKGVAFTCIAGDVARDGTAKDFNYVKQYFALANHPIYCVKGNHDNYQSSSSTTSGYKAATGCENDFVKEYNGDVFIFLSMANKDYASGGLDSSKVTWVKNQLSTYKNKRKFFIFHIFINGTCGNPNNLYWSPMSSSNSNVKSFTQAICAEQKLIYISGHSHFLFNLQDKYSNANYYHKSGECYHVHVPGNARPRDASTNTIYNKGEGYIVDVYKDKVIFRGFDVTTKAYKTSYVYTINLPQ